MRLPAGMILSMRNREIKQLKEKIQKLERINKALLRELKKAGIEVIIVGKSQNQNRKKTTKALSQTR